MHKKIEKVFSVLKKHKDIRVGFADIDLWADTGVPALNRKLSNTYNRGFLYGRTIGVYGESGSGKSLLLAQTAANEQKNNGAFIVWIDVEGAVSDLKEGTRWFQQTGIDTENNFQRIHLATFKHALKTMSEFVNIWREDEETKELPPLFIVFDSYSNLQTESMIEQNKGKKDLTGDQGQKAKQLGDFLVRLTGMIEGLRILVTGVNHVFMNQDQYGPVFKLSGGMKVVFTASQCILLSKSELRNEDASEHNKISDDADSAKKTIGIKSTAHLIKCRYAKPFEKVVLEVIYPRGIDRHSGLWDMFVDDGVITSPTQGWYEFTRPDGTKSAKFRRKQFINYVEELLTFPIPDRPMNPDNQPLDEEIFEEETIDTEPQEAA
jgi:RecA/RadA recombinase